MGWLDIASKLADVVGKREGLSFEKDPSVVKNVIDYGKQTIAGGHDHRVNKGPDRTPAQKKGDLKRRKS